MLKKVQVLTFESVDEILKVLMIHDHEQMFQFSLSRNPNLS